MKIMFKIPDGDFVEKEVKKGTTLETLYKEVEDEVKYPCIAAKVDNEYQGLTYKVKESCRVELLDMRSKGANRIYQSSLSMVFLCAARKVISNTFCKIANTLNLGLYIELIADFETTDEMALVISDEMQALIDRDMPFVSESLPRDEWIARIKETGDKEKLKLVESRPEVKTLPLYTLDGYSEFFYSIMVPSTKYVRWFRLEKYRGGFLLRFPNKYVPVGVPDYDDEVNMYKAFCEQNEWDELMGVNYVSDLNRKIENNEYKDLILLSEALHDKKINEIANMVTDQNRRLVLIAGPSSSGKTTFAKRLCVHLKVNGKKALYMGTDDYFKNRDEMTPDANGDYDFEGLDAVDTELFDHDMQALIKGETVDIPEFDFKEGKKFFGNRLTKIDENTVIVIEGIHALNELLTSHVRKEDKFKIYISPLTQLNIDQHNRISVTDSRMLRRIVRDYQFRGHTAQNTIKSWPNVRAGENKNVFPFNGEADVFINSMHVYEIGVLKKYAMPLLSDIGPDEEEYAEAQRLLQFLRFFETIEDDHYIVNNSILREFIGGSVFVD